MPDPTEGEATTAEDTSVSEAVDTSTNDDPTDLEDIEVSLEELDGEEEVESSDDEEDEPASESEPEEQSEEDVEQESDSPDPETKEDDTASEEKTQKQIAQEAYKRREAERKLREEREAREKENLARYLAEAEGDEVELAKRQIEVEKHYLQREKATVLQDKLTNGIEKAIASIDLFRTGTPEIQEELAKSLDDFERMYVAKDKAGNYVEVRADVYQYLQDKADSIRRLTGIGAREQTKQKANEKTRTVARPTRAPKEPTVDKDLNDFDEGWDS